MSHLYPTLLLCVSGFFFNLRPSEPFLTAFLMGPDKNLTESQVVNQIFPVWTYSYLALLFPVFLATDYLCYKPVLILQTSGLVVTYVMLLKANSVWAMQLMEFLFGLATASEVAYFSYIYSVVDPTHYQRVTGYCRSVTLFGSAVGSLLGQLLFSLANVQLYYLVVITMASAAVAFVPPWFLPMPKRSLFFHKSPKSLQDEPGSSTGLMQGETEGKAPVAENGPQDSVESKSADSVGQGLGDVLRLLFSDFLVCYRSRPLLAWSLWWALATCGYFQILNYIQVLWEKVRPSQDYDIYNGYVETLSTVLGALAALLVGHLPVCWSVWGELALALLSLLMTLCIFGMNLFGNIWACYSLYVLFRAVYMLLITVATFQIATSLNMQRYALVFGVNTFVALFLQSLLTLVVVDSVGLGLDIYTQFLIYGGYFALISLIFLGAGLYKLYTIRRSEQKDGCAAESQQNDAPNGNISPS